MELRAARPDDAETLRTAVSRAREEAVLDDIGAPNSLIPAAGVREAVAEAEWSFIIETESRPVGLAIAHPDADGTEAELLALWVHPSRVGEGVAAELLARMGRALDDDGVETLRASVPSDHPSVQEFFMANEFAPRGTRRSPAGDETVVTADPSALV